MNTEQTTREATYEKFSMGYIVRFIRNGVNHKTTITLNEKEAKEYAQDYIECGNTYRGV